jgi:hypothetical protein
MNSVPVAADLRIMIHELIKTVAQGTDIDCFNLYYYSTEKGAKKKHMCTVLHGRLTALLCWMRAARAPLTAARWLVSGFPLLTLSASRRKQ